MSDSFNKTPDAPAPPDQAAFEETACLYLLSALPEKERRAFQERLDSGHAASLAAVEKIKPVVDALYMLAQPVEPPKALRDRLLDRIRHGKPMLSVEVRSEAGEWMKVPGYEIWEKTLFINPETRQRSWLMRMAPGSFYPAHSHSYSEQCLVIEGDLWLGDREYRAGDFVAGVPYRKIPPLSSRTGNVVLVIGEVDG